MRVGAMLVLFVLVLAGCGSSDPRVTVSGQVSLDGEPIKEGTIRFEPTDGKSPSAGAAIANGGYTLKVHPGKVRVLFEASKTVGKRKAYDAPDSPYLPILEPIIPAKYLKEPVQKEISSGDQQLDFPLTSK